MLAFPRNLLPNRLLQSLICYLGDNRRAATLRSTFHHVSQQGLSFVCTHPYPPFIRLLIVHCRGYGPGARPARSLRCQPFGLQTGATSYKGRLRIPQESCTCLGLRAKPASPMILELHEGQGLSESRDWGFGWFHCCFFYGQGCSRPSVTALSH